jgi:phosphoenolpyruvate carboxylase
VSISREAAEYAAFWLDETAREKEKIYDKRYIKMLRDVAAYLRKTARPLPQTRVRSSKGELMREDQRVGHYTDPETGRVVRTRPTGDD